MKEEQSGEREETREETVTMTPVQIALWVGMCCLVLVLLYMYYDYLVYFFIWIFCLTSSVGLYQTLWLLVCRLPVGKCRVPENKLPYLKQRPEVRMLLLGVVCVSVSITWGVFRNDDRWAWVLQDTMGMACCLYMMKILTLPSFRACTLLLVSLLVYDVFFVFITPYITKSGESIMVEVGGGPSDSSSQEKLPMVLKVPYLNFSAVVLCNRPFLLLGLGDICIPGLLIAYCHRFDVLLQSSRVYFLVSTVGYSVGLVLSFACALLMRAAQPALLYLVPCSLLCSLVVALWRSELKLFWNGVVSLPSPISMATVTQTLTSTNQEPEVCDVTNQGEAPPPATEEERPQRTEETTQMRTCRGDVNLTLYVNRGDVNLTLYVNRGDVNLTLYVNRGDVNLTLYVNRGDVNLTLYVNRGDVNLTLGDVNLTLYVNRGDVNLTLCEQRGREPDTAVFSGV
ncbi:signal peptide peptidase-like 2 isoform X1 [Tachysurus ichikawai]